MQFTLFFPPEKNVPQEISLLHVTNFVSWLTKRGRLKKGKVFFYFFCCANGILTYDPVKKFVHFINCCRLLDFFLFKRRDFCFLVCCPFCAFAFFFFFFLITHPPRLPLYFHCTSSLLFRCCFSNRFLLMLA